MYSKPGTTLVRMPSARYRMVVASGGGNGIRTESEWGFNTNLFDFTLEKRKCLQEITVRLTLVGVGYLSTYVGDIS